MCNWDLVKNKSLTFVSVHCFRNRILVAILINHLCKHVYFFVSFHSENVIEIQCSGVNALVRHVASPYDMSSNVAPPFAPF